MTLTSISNTFAYEEDPANIETVQQEFEQTTYYVTPWLEDDLIIDYNIPNIAVAGQDYAASIQKWGGTRTSFSDIKVFVGGKCLRENVDYIVNINGDYATLTVFESNINGDIHILVNISN